MNLIVRQLLTLLILSGAAWGQPREIKTILAIFAHPDDENIIGDVLAKYARLGHNVYVIIATDGKYGTRVSTIPAGDSLGRLRRQESTCAAQALGIHPPIFLGIERLDTKIGVRAYLDGHSQLLDSVRTHLLRLQPDAIITFGPDGEYGHSEHIVVGATVVDVLLREGWVDTYPLFFPVDVKEDVEDDHDLSYVHKDYINLVVEYSDEDEQKSFQAAGCYGTQFTPQEVQELMDRKSKDTSNRKFFRRFCTPKEVQHEF